MELILVCISKTGPFFHQIYLRVNATQPLIVNNLGIKLVVYKYVERVKLKKLQLTHTLISPVFEIPSE